MSLQNNNIFVPYREGFHDKKNYESLKEYYNFIGFNVIWLDSGHEMFNLPASINEAFKYNQEEYVVINNIFLSAQTIKNAINISTNSNSLVIPYKMIYYISKESINDVVDSLKDNSILENFEYIFFTEPFTFGSAWVIPDNLIKKNGPFNDRYLHPVGYDFDFCTRHASLNKIIFMQNDAFCVPASGFSLNGESILVYSNHLKSIKNIFGEQNVFVQKNLELIEFDNSIEIFSPERHLINHRIF